MDQDLSPDEHDPPNALPRGTLLNDKFRLQRVIGVGGFGIVYLAHDEMSDVDVAIKEYMPTSLAGRTKTMQVSLTSQSNAETFALGLKSFWNEARLLARFRDEHLPLLKVYDAFQANGTAYMVMPVLRGRTAYQLRREMPKPPSERWLRKMLAELLPALERLHAENVYHRDIAPDNIQLDIQGKVILMDLGAARHVISNRTQSITAILKPGYAPIEQYGENEALRQGPWTDLYALGATLHFMLLGKAPAPATARLFDPGLALCAQDLPGCSGSFLRVIDWMMAVRPEQRPQGVAQLRAALDDSVDAARAAAPKKPTRAAVPPVETPLRVPTGAIAATAPRGAPQTKPPSTLATSCSQEQESESTVVMTLPANAARGSRPPAPMVLAGAAAVALVAGAAAWLWPHQQATGAAAARTSASAPEGVTAATAARARSEPSQLPPTDTPTLVAFSSTAAETVPVSPPTPAPAARPPTLPPATTAKRDNAPIQTKVALAAGRAPLPAAPTSSNRSAGPINDKQGALLPKMPEPAPDVAVALPPPPPPAPPSAPVAPAVTAATPTLASPSERCSAKTGFGLKVCVALVCGLPELHNHPECVAIRRR